MSIVLDCLESREEIVKRRDWRGNISRILEPSCDGCGGKREAEGGKAWRRRRSRLALQRRRDLSKMPVTASSSVVAAGGRLGGRGRE